MTPVTQKILFRGKRKEGKGINNIEICAGSQVKGNPSGLVILTRPISALMNTP